MPRIRQNIVTGEWVVVAPERAKRPQEYAARPFASGLLHDSTCRFCVGQDVWKTRMHDASTKHLYVVPNKYPAFVSDAGLQETGHGFYTDDGSFGQHEVIVLTDPGDTLPHMTAHRMGELLMVLRERALAYEKDASIESITPIYNHGHEAGTSVAHPHAQLFGNALVPPRLAKEFFGAEQYHTRHRHCVFCEQLTFEMKEHVRIVSKNNDAVAFAEYAPRFPFELRIIPTLHQHAFSHASDQTLAGVGQVLSDCCRKLAKKLNDPSLNWFIHTARQIDHHQSASYHWHIEITPRLSTYGGYELASDMTIETVIPETATQFLRN